MPKRTCSIDGCGRIVTARGWCRRHYERWRSHGDPITLVTAPRGALPAFIRTVFDGTAPHEPNGCVLWPFGIAGSGYPLVEWEGEKRTVGHLVLEHFAGPRPSDRHTMGHAPHEVCGNRHCVAPEHLSWQTYAENLRQAADVDRTISGERHHAARISDDQVRDAVRRVQAGDHPRSVAESLGVSITSIYDWSSGKRRAV